MRKVRSLLAVVLFVWCYGKSQGDGCLSDLNGCCKLCKPGYFLKNGCGPCEACPVRGYMDKPNSQPRCRACRRCEGIFQYKSHCNATQNAVCGCKRGKKCADEECSQCEENPCPAGQQLNGAECENCPSGTFNPGTEGTCKPWKNCWAIGADILENGSRTSDVVCSNRLVRPTRMPPTLSATSTKAVPSNGMDIAIPVVISAVFFIVVFVVAIVCLLLKVEKIKNKFKPIKQTKDEDGCSCHFPEEEDGGEYSDPGSTVPTPHL